MDILKYYVNEWYRNRIKMKSNFYCQIHLTTRCQNNCSHCYFRELRIPSKDMPLPQLKELLLSIKSKSQQLKLTPRIDFTGGDPFLYPYLESAVQYCKELKIPYGFKCNPEMLVSPSSSIRSILLDSSGISLSLDGLREMHDSFRKTGSFDCTLEAIKTIKSLGLQLKINTTISHKNINNIIPLFNFLVSEKFIIDDYTWSRYWSLEDPSQIINAQQLESVFSEMIQYYHSLLLSPSFFYKTTDGRLIPRIMLSFKEHQWYAYFVKNNLLLPDVIESIVFSNNCINCTATKHYYIIDPDMAIYKCRKLPESRIMPADFGKEIECDFLGKHNAECIDCLHYNGCGGCAAITKCFTLNPFLSEPLCPYKTKKVKA